MKQSKVSIIRGKKKGKIKDVVDFFISIANTDFNVVDDDAVVKFKDEYFGFTLKFADKYPLLDSGYMLLRFELDYSDGYPSDKIAEIREFFSKIQSYLDGVVGSLVDLANDEKKVDVEEIFSIAGKKEVRFNNISGEFVVKFVPSNFEPKEPFDVRNDKTFLKLVLMDLISEAGLRADRFARCGKCLNYFYKYTGIKRKYCSKECSNAASQAKFYQRKKEEREKRKKAKQ